MVFLSRSIVGMLLIVAGVLKVIDFESFRQTITAYKVLESGKATSLLASAIAGFEVIVGVSLLCGWLLPLSADAALVMLWVFTTVVAVAIFRGRTNIPCGCRIPGRQTIGWHLCIRNLSLISFIVPSAAHLSSAASSAILVFGILPAGTAVTNFNVSSAILPGHRVNHLTGEGGA